MYIPVGEQAVTQMIILQSEVKGKLEMKKNHQDQKEGDSLLLKSCRTELSEKNTRGTNRIDLVFSNFPAWKRLRI